MDVTVQSVSQYLAHNIDYDEAQLERSQTMADYNAALSDWSALPEEDRGDQPEAPDLPELPPETRPLIRIAFTVDDSSELAVCVEPTATDEEIKEEMRAAIKEAESLHNVTAGDTIAL